MGKFVTFEGIDGSGKSTVIKEVAKRLRKRGMNVIVTSEPTDSLVGRYVADCIKQESDPFLISFAFIADRIDHCNKIKSWLDAGNIVLCDRYAESTYAYQAAQLEGVMEDPIRWLKELSTPHILVPDLSFLFDIDPIVAMKRIGSREELIPFEKTAFLQKVREWYLRICTGENFIVVDASLSLEELVDSCVERILGS